MSEQRGQLVDLPMFLIRQREDPWEQEQGKLYGFLKRISKTINPFKTKPVENEQVEVIDRRTQTQNFKIKKNLKSKQRKFDQLSDDQKQAQKKGNQVKNNDIQPSYQITFGHGYFPQQKTGNIQYEHTQPNSKEQSQKGQQQKKTRINSQPVSPLKKRNLANSRNLTIDQAQTRRLKKKMSQILLVNAPFNVKTRRASEESGLESRKESSESKLKLKRSVSNSEKKIELKNIGFPKIKRPQNRKEQPKIILSSATKKLLQRRFDMGKIRIENQINSTQQRYGNILLNKVQQYFNLDNLDKGKFNYFAKIKTEENIHDAWMDCLKAKVNKANKLFSKK